MLDWLALALLLVTGSLGLNALLRWLRRPGAHLPVPIVTVHVLAAVATVGLWLLWLGTRRGEWAWSAFGAMNLNNLMGDAMLTRRWRDAVGRRAWWHDYWRGLRAIYTGHRPSGTVHLWAAGLTYVVLLAACLRQV